MTSAIQDRDNNQKLRLWEPHIHAFAELCPNETRRKGPLAGLRVGVKDIIDVAGVPTRNGSDACRNTAPAIEDAAVVAKLRDAGAHIVGKTITTEFAFTDPTDCRNPYDLRRSPGGSSSGSGAAVAAGAVDIALGTQTAGSLCRPAAYCGACGFKPTHGILPTTGVTPLAPSFDTVGIIAGSVARLKQAFAVLAPLNTPRTDDVPDGIISGLWQTKAAAESDTLAGLKEATRKFAQLGKEVTERSFPTDVTSIVLAHRIVMNYEAFVAHGAMLSDGRAHCLKPKFLTGLRSGATVSPENAAEAIAFLALEKQTFWAGLEDVGVILTLPVPEGAPSIDGTTGFQDWLTPWTVFGGPLICLPWGLDQLGRPRSVMLAAAPGRDATLLAVAAKLERVCPVLPPPQLPQD